MSNATMLQKHKKTSVAESQRLNAPLQAKTQSDSGSLSPHQLVDHRPQALLQRRMQELADASPQTQQLQALQRQIVDSPRASQLKTMQRMSQASAAAAQLNADVSSFNQAILTGAGDSAPVQAKAEESDALSPPGAATATPINQTGLPDNLKAGIESLSGMSMDHVKVHYNSSQPAQLNAHAYAQGSDIHVAPGQEKHLPHEAWHVVQQAQGRVKPTMQMKAGVAVNDDAGLEAEADQMGKAATNSLLSDGRPLQGKLASSFIHPTYQTIQRMAPSSGGGGAGDPMVDEGETEIVSEKGESSSSAGNGTNDTPQSGSYFIEKDYEDAIRTPYKSLVSGFDEELVSKAKLNATQENSIARPKRVKAMLNGVVAKRDKDSITSIIGHLGNDEWAIRGDSKMSPKYEGGHLIGNQVIGGDIADEAWNVAPQDGKNNSPAYSNTIERMLRDAEYSGETICYEVEVFYTNINYEVNALSLIDRGILKKDKVLARTDKSIPKAVQIPARIPSHWKATATLSGDKTKFGAPSKHKEDGGKTYLQQVEVDPFKNTAGTKRDLGEKDEGKEYGYAQYNLFYKNSNFEDIVLPKNNEKEFKEKLSNVKQVSYHMTQAHISSFKDTNEYSGLLLNDKNLLHQCEEKLGDARNDASEVSSQGTPPSERKPKDEYKKLEESWKALSEEWKNSSYDASVQEISGQLATLDKLPRKWSDFWDKVIAFYEKIDLQKLIKEIETTRGLSEEGFQKGLKDKVAGVLKDWEQNPFATEVKIKETESQPEVTKQHGGSKRIFSESGMSSSVDRPNKVRKQSQESEKIQPFLLGFQNFFTEFDKSKWKKKNQPIDKENFKRLLMNHSLSVNKIMVGKLKTYISAIKYFKNSKSNSEKLNSINTDNFIKIEEALESKNPSSEALKMIDKCLVEIAKLQFDLKKLENVKKLKSDVGIGIDDFFKGESFTPFSGSTPAFSKNLSAQQNTDKGLRTRTASANFDFKKTFNSTYLGYTDSGMLDSKNSAENNTRIPKKNKTRD